GLGHAMRDCYAAMGGMPGELRLSGGAARSAGLRAILAAALDRPLRISSRDEAGAAGAAMMAAVAIGAYPDIDACLADWVTPLLEPAEEPDPDLSARYARLFPAFVATRQNLAPAWDSLATARQDNAEASEVAPARERT
ncbi:carbohydrate kinase, partial [Thioclava sp. BHET1]